MKNSIYDINYLWIMFVILHMSGAALLMIFAGFPYLYLILLNALMVAFIVYTGRVSKIRLLQHLRIKVPTGKQILFAVIMTILLLIMSEYINAISLIFVRNYVGSVLASASSNLPMTLLTYAIVPAIAEEMMFRGCILRGTSNKLIGLLVSAVTFALLHGNLNQMCYAFFMGLGFGIMVLLTDNLSITMMMHCLFNGYSILSVAFANSRVVNGIENVKIGSYSIFAPIIEKSQMEMQLVIGFIVFMIAGVLIYLLMRAMYKEKCNTIFVTDMDTLENPWKPDIKFFIGCVICIGLAIISG